MIMVLASKYLLFELDKCYELLKYRSFQNSRISDCLACLWWVITDQFLPISCLLCNTTYYVTFLLLFYLFCVSTQSIPYVNVMFVNLKIVDSDINLNRRLFVVQFKSYDNLIKLCVFQCLSSWSNTKFPGTSTTPCPPLITRTSSNLDQENTSFYGDFCSNFTF